LAAIVILSFKTQKVIF